MVGCRVDTPTESNRIEAGSLVDDDDDVDDASLSPLCVGVRRTRREFSGFTQPSEATRGLCSRPACVLGLGADRSIDRSIGRSICTQQFGSGVVVGCQFPKAVAEACRSSCLRSINRIHSRVCRSSLVRPTIPTTGKWHGFDPGDYSSIDRIEGFDWLFWLRTPRLHIGYVIIEP